MRTESIEERDVPMSTQAQTLEKVPRSRGPEDLSIDDRLAKFSRDLEHLKAESKGWVKTWGVYLGILGAFIAVPKSALDLVTQVWVRPDTSVTVKNVKITHAPGLSSEIVEFPLVVMNLGNRDDAFLGRGATLTAAGGSVELSEDDFGLYDNGKKIETPLLVPKDAVRAYVVSITFSSKTRELAATPGQHTLEMRFPGVNQSYAARLCFPLQQSDVDVLFKSDQLETEYFLTQCPGGARGGS